METLLYLTLGLVLLSLFFQADYWFRALGRNGGIFSKRRKMEETVNMDSKFAATKVDSHDYQVLHPWNYELRKLGHPDVYTFRDPAEALENVVRRYQESGTRSRYDDLIHLPNYISNLVAQSESIQKALGKVADFIDKMDRTMPFLRVSSARLFEHENFQGRQLFIDNHEAKRYVLIPFGYFDGLRFNDVTSSLKLHTSGASSVLNENTCILFEHAGFQGNFRAFAFSRNREINRLPDFNDQCSSGLLVSHDLNPNKTLISVKRLVGEKFNEAADRQLGQKPGKVWRSGDVMATFALDEQNGNDLMKLEIPITVKTPWWYPSNVYASFGYYIDFFIDANHHLQAAVVSYWYSIEATPFGGAIRDELKPEVEKGVGYLQAELNSMLKELDWHKWADVYLLPGAGTVGGDFSGHINDDCTLVLPYQDEAENTRQ